MVTTIFEAVTERMKTPTLAEPEPSTFVAASDLAGGVALAAAPPQTPIKTRSKEVGFQVLTGAVGTLLESLEAGASGTILGFGACAPQACQEVYFAWKDHDLKLAAEKQQRIVGPAKRIVGDLGIAGVKHACDFNGFYGGKPRLPLLPLTSAQKNEVEALLAGIRN
jgi:dihydrodipicolinate synthase/N-acetylneuraminate lyase